MTNNIDESYLKHFDKNPTYHYILVEPKFQIYGDKTPSPEAFAQCETCFCMVPADYLVDHAQWHEQC